MRWVMLDTETTGLRVEEGHRLIEIGCIECIDRRITDRSFHVFINPEREIDEGATQVHGMTWDQLKDKPFFAEVAQGLVEFVQGAEVVIHNAEFDRGFLDAELKRAGLEPFSSYCTRLTDSLGHARELHPGQRNSLDALCQRYGISNEHRVLHGALLDARLLAEVYLAMTRGQEALLISSEDDADAREAGIAIDTTGLIVRRATDEELQAHEVIMQEIDRASGGKRIWPHQA
ncbi:MAG: DNA polymerase III subunit epsilon [Betaproteobacteria bacterium]|jgi:DNA polymerase-3 subunit epsilon|nr:DNA polymerase III subunit epsilon [Betaproteobacteria bacterium]